MQHRPSYTGTGIFRTVHRLKTRRGCTLHKRGGCKAVTLSHNHSLSSLSHLQWHQKTADHGFNLTHIRQSTNSPTVQYSTVQYSTAQDSTMAHENRGAHARQSKSLPHSTNLSLPSNLQAYTKPMPMYLPSHHQYPFLLPITCKHPCRRPPLRSACRQSRTLRPRHLVLVLGLSVNHHNHTPATSSYYNTTR